MSLLKIVALSMTCTTPLVCIACGSSSSDSPGAAAGAGGASVASSGGASGLGISDAGNSGISVGGGALTDVEAVVTCDNAYGFGWGTASQLDNYRAAPASVTAGDIFACNIGPEGYSIPAADAPESAYLYAIAWADHSVTQGLIGQFKRTGGTPIYTGDPEWQVCATGIDYDSRDPVRKAGPPLLEINSEIAKCNSGSADRATSSAGWVDRSGAVTAGAIGALAIGQDNSTAYAPDFPIVCPSGGSFPAVDVKARWMWYSSSMVESAFNFSSLEASRPFLIFRLPALALPPPR
jgi:hypothetical protein